MTKYYLIDPELYDNQFWWKTDDLEFWKNKLLSKKKNRILELAAGTGRIASPLIREKAIYTGIELSDAYVKYANHKLHNLYGYSNISQGDMRSFTLNQCYDYIFIGFNSILHLLTESDALDCLDSIKKHMNKKSVLYIDLFVPHPLFLYKPKNSILNILNFKDTRLNEMVDVFEQLEYNSKSEIASVVWSYICDKKQVYKDFSFKMKMYYPDAMQKLFEKSGLSIVNIWGSYQEDKFTENSNLQIYECMLK